MALDPVHELYAAIGRGDFRPIGVCGYVCEPLGVNAGDYGIVDVRHLNVIAGTTDSPGNRDVERLNATAAWYASNYNMFLVSYLRTHPSATRGSGPTR